MPDEKLSGEEQRQLLKEQFKKDLREREAFLEKMKELKQEQKIVKALESMNPEDDTDEWINKLNEESAFSEAKTEMALEAVKSDETPLVDEELLKKSVAEEMVARLKAEMKKESEAAEKPKAEEKPEEKNPPKNLLDEIS
jgi:lipopolysaccharide export LptBFGC system permease protein LptF